MCVQADATQSEQVETSDFVSAVCWKKVRLIYRSELVLGRGSEPVLVGTRSPTLKLVPHKILYFFSRQVVVLPPIPINVMEYNCRYTDLIFVAAVL